MIDHFSQRRAEIVAAMAEHGTSSAAAAEVAAYRTRDAKDYTVDPDTQRQEWVARAAEFDLTPDSIDRMLLEAAAASRGRSAPADLDHALADLEAHHSHFDRRDLSVCARQSAPRGRRRAGAGGARSHARSPPIG